MESHFGSRYLGTDIDGSFHRKFNIVQVKLLKVLRVPEWSLPGSENRPFEILPSRWSAVDLGSRPAVGYTLVPLCLESAGAPSPGRWSLLLSRRIASGRTTQSWAEGCRRTRWVWTREKLDRSAGSLELQILFWFNMMYFLKKKLLEWFEINYILK